MSDRRYGADEHDPTYERGREDERAAVAAWMRDSGNPTAPALPLVAAAIERGEHLRSDDE